jgi:hypothetical protein
MEARAQAWEVSPRPAAEIEAAKAAGKVPCGPCDAWVPAWFGEDCIATRCPLKVAAA